MTKLDIMLVLHLVYAGLRSIFQTFLFWFATKFIFCFRDSLKLNQYTALKRTKQCVEICVYAEKIFPY